MKLWPLIAEIRHFAWRFKEKHATNLVLHHASAWDVIYLHPSEDDRPTHAVVPVAWLDTIDWDGESHAHLEGDRPW